MLQKMPYYHNVVNREAHFLSWPNMVGSGSFQISPMNILYPLILYNLFEPKPSLILTKLFPPFAVMPFSTSKFSVKLFFQCVRESNMFHNFYTLYCFFHFGLMEDIIRICLWCISLPPFGYRKIMLTNFWKIENWLFWMQFTSQ
jgi:hypothetical protein